MDYTCSVVTYYILIVIHIVGERMITLHKFLNKFIGQQQNKTHF